MSITSLSFNRGSERGEDGYEWARVMSETSVRIHIYLYRLVIQSSSVTPHQTDAKGNSNKQVNASEDVLRVAETVKRVVEQVINDFDSG